jgi:hypothetical protein
MTNPSQTFRLLDPHGATIATGSFDALLERLPDSLPRMRAEEAIQAAARAVAREAGLDARADAAAQREAKLVAREDAIAAADRVRRMTDSVLKLQHRLDEFEQRRRVALAALPDEDEHADNLEAVLPPPEDEDREQLESALKRGSRSGV